MKGSNLCKTQWLLIALRICWGPALFSWSFAQSWDWSAVDSLAAPASCWRLVASQLPQPKHLPLCFAQVREKGERSNFLDVSRTYVRTLTRFTLTTESVWYMHRQQVVISLFLTPLTCMFSCGCSEARQWAVNHVEGGSCPVGAWFVSWESV